MPSLNRRRSPKADPAPSRWSYRMQRLMLTPLFRLTLRAGLPFAVSLGAATWFLSDPDTQAAIRDTVAETRASIEQRPEFMVNLMAIDGGDPELADAIRTAIPLDFPISSFDLDPAAMRARILEMPPIREASVRIRPGGVLQIDLIPRVPVAIWRTPEGLTLIDESGVHVGPIARRGLRPNLPVIAGDGAPAHVHEALTLVRAGAPLGNRLRGLVRLGDRRWDVVLDRDQRIMLPVENPVGALERVIALHGVDEVLSRDIARIDLRLTGRPTVRMNTTATEEWWRIRQLNSGTE
ncbi:cell division protein FtsQ/DivIB [uncultured Tateyamaria sp.]|uniref:cell division protein FtsQ/DivIB n=1 Tax=uncultured Tateyamaria sp. TaxID=455651 RepID=UPI00262BFEAB|nr:cell division protein FtsQ/DivIB [uncultured Tateyamaria sp.]